MNEFVPGLVFGFIAGAAIATMIIGPCSDAAWQRAAVREGAAIYARPDGKFQWTTQPEGAK